MKVSKDLKEFEVWFVTGSQHLYGDEALRIVADDSQKITQGLNNSGEIPVKVVYKPVLTTPDAIFNLCNDCNSAKNCIGLITWMHTFSPAKMWIHGLKALRKPFLHLHTQFNRDIPWDSIDMDFMNLNQSAHGGREFGFMATRLGIDRKVVTGHWEDSGVRGEISAWCRAACGWHTSQHLKVARFGDNMRNVAVTEGDKVEAQMKFGYAVDGFGVGDLVDRINAVSANQVNDLINEYNDTYEISGGILKSQRLSEAARIELGMKLFLEEGGFQAFTTTFEDLHGLGQLPGLAVQRLMEQGYGFGAEGDWKTAALVRIMKVMSQRLTGGTSFMEDYTYHLEPGRMQVLGAHMLEVCPSIATGKPKLEIHPLGIGGKDDPARLVFDSQTGSALNASIVDMGNRFRMIVNTVDVVKCPELPKLPVARVLWEPNPDLKTAATAWILAGGAHHTGFSMALTQQHMLDFAEMAGIECLCINNETRINDFKKEIKWNNVYYKH
jgi:L-arabinose isomerase